MPAVAALVPGSPLSPALAPRSPQSCLRRGLYVVATGWKSPWVWAEEPGHTLGPAGVLPLPLG